MTDKTVTQNVLDEMVAGITGAKSDKATKLTPVGSERRLPRTSSPFPNDDPQQVVEQAVADLRRQIKHLTEAADALEREVLGREPSPVEEAGAVKAAEREADARHAVADSAVEGGEDPEPFSARLARLSAEAQASVFTTRDAESDPAPPSWQCPKHGLDKIVTLTSRKGRNYLACAVEGTTPPHEFQK